VANVQTNSEREKVKIEKEGREKRDLKHTNPDQWSLLFFTLEDSEFVAACYEVSDV